MTKETDLRNHQGEGENQDFTLSIDAMGGDHGPSVIVAGLALALPDLLVQSKKTSGNLKILLHGAAEELERQLEKWPTLLPHCVIKPADFVIGGEEKPTQALRRGKGSSLWNAVESVKTGEARAIVSAGNTGALMAISKLILRMIADLDRPAIAASWPTLNGISIVLDVGANIDCSASQLVEFAILGAAFYEAVHRETEASSPVEARVKTAGGHPTVGLLNVGSEEAKGHQEVKEAHILLQNADFNLDYKGFVEGNDIALGRVDVVVTDGFTGNVALKTGEGMARFLSATLRSYLGSGLLNRLGAGFAFQAFRALKDRLDPSNVNGGPLLGLRGTVIKSHGGADAKGVANAVLLAADLANSPYQSVIYENLERFSRKKVSLSEAAVATPPVSTLVRDS